MSRLDTNSPDRVVSRIRLLMFVLTTPIASAVNVYEWLRDVRVFDKADTVVPLPLRSHLTWVCDDCRQPFNEHQLDLVTGLILLVPSCAVVGIALWLA